jgi:hypothetical protein
MIKRQADFKKSKVNVFLMWKNKHIFAKLLSFPSPPLHFPVKISYIQMLKGKALSYLVNLPWQLPILKKNPCFLI